MASIRYRRATYTDGELVKEGDYLRYHQAPGGLMAAPEGWNYGTAVKIPAYENPEKRKEDAEYGIDVDQLVLRCESGPYAGSHCNLFGHVIERAVRP